VSERGCNYKTRAETTYLLEVERQDNVSDCSCNHKTRAEMTYSLVVEKVACQIAFESTKRGQGQRTAWT
jgi:hypothetical protein